ncbi:MAG: hydrogenase maturation nickel metallochaperone HypA [Azoarcus sp.]|nr:hydrogenase maturation nickel metallochaperone HypA [Azoarcus sp.]
MHEMSLAEGVRNIVEESACAHGGKRVERVVLQIGELAAVEVEALRFCLELILKDGVADGALIDIEITPGRGWCAQCASTVALAQLYDACPQCGSYRVQATGGTEMRVKELALAATWGQSAS